MYLHIGKDYIININDIIGIFDIESLKKTNSYDCILKKIKFVKDLSGGKRKSLIITKNNNKLNAYISNILSTTIASRNDW